MKLIVDKGSNGLTTKEFTEYLKTPVLKSEITQKEADELRKQLEDGLEKYPGIGISATQLGIKKRACLIKFGEDDNKTEIFLLNPIIKEKSKEGFLFYEGCLSMPSTITKPIKTAIWESIYYS
jgi:peptide deformylase